MIHFEAMRLWLLVGFAAALSGAGPMGASGQEPAVARGPRLPGDPGATLQELEAILRGLPSSDRGARLTPPAPRPPRVERKTPLTRWTAGTAFHWIDLQARLIDFKLGGLGPEFRTLSFEPILRRVVRWEGKIVDCGERLFGGFECRIAMEPGYGEGVAFKIPDRAVATRLAKLNRGDRIRFTGAIQKVLVIERPKLKVLVILRDVTLRP
jgi:hypothetical protein